MGNTHNLITDNQPLGAGEFQRLVDAPAADLADAVLSLVKGDTTSAVILGPPVTLSYDGANDFLDVDSPTNRPAAGWWQGKVGQWAEGDDGFADVPFENDGTSVYYVGVKHGEVPASVTLRRALALAYAYATVTPSLGFRPTISSVADHGTGLRFVVTSDDLGPAFANTSDARPVTVWKVNPVTASAEAIATGTVVWTGSAFRVDLTHYLGQSSAGFSSTPADYVVHVHGISVNKATNLATVLTGGTQAYLMLGAFDSATGLFSYASQVRVAALEETSTSALVFGGLRKALRAGCYIGGHEATRDWNFNTNVTVNTAVDPVTITFADPFSGIDDAYVFTGDLTSGREPELSQAWASGGLVATIAKSLATGTYHIVAEVDRNGELALRVVSDATWTGGGADYARRVLHVWQFGFTTTSGAVASIVESSLALRRGIAAGHLLSSGTDADGEAVEVSEIVGGSTVSVLLEDASGAVDAALGIQRADLLGVYTSGATIGFRNGNALAAGEGAAVLLGGLAEYSLHARNDAGTLRLDGLYDGSSYWTRHLRTGGNANATTGRVKVEDLHLLTYKDVWETLDIGAGSHDGNWTRDVALAGIDPYSMGWHTTTDSTTIVFPIPVKIGPGTGAATEIVAVRIYIGAGDTLRTTTATVYKSVMAHAGPTVTAITGATDFQIGDASGWHDLTCTTPEVVAVDTNYFVAVTTNASGGSYRAWASGLQVKRRTRQML